MPAVRTERPDSGQDLWTVSGEATITGPDFAETDNQYQGIVGDLGIPVNLNYLQRTYQLNGLPE